MVIGDERAERELATKTRNEFDKAAHGAALSEPDKAGKADEAHHTHDLEPSLQEKKQGLAYDKGAAQNNFDRFKAGQSQERTRGFDLSR